jgi:hypothetical protein
MRQLAEATPVVEQGEGEGAVVVAGEGEAVVVGEGEVVDEGVGEVVDEGAGEVVVDGEGEGEGEVLEDVDPLDGDFDELFGGLFPRRGGGV